MSQLLAVVCNDPDRVRCALHPVRAALVATAEAERGFDAWGIGLYQHGEVLLKRRPQPTHGPVDFYAIAAELRTDTFIAHARTATVGDNRNENTHPFRFRSWLFAHHGTLPGFGPRAGSTDPTRPSPRQQALADALLAEIPDFLRRNLRGQSDSEILFHLFLTRLHEMSQLDVGDVRLQDAQTALARTIARLDETLASHGVRDEGGNALGVLTLANGRHLLAATRGAPLYQHRVHGIKDCEVCRDPAGAHGKPRPIDHDHLRAVVLVAGKPEGVDAPFTAVDPAGTLLCIARDLTVSETPLHR